MQAAFAVLVLVVVALSAVGKADDDKYPSKYDNIDVDQILNNDRVSKVYQNCILSDNDSGCTPEAKEIKRHISEALTNDCAKCTEKQKENVDKICKHLIQKHRDIWEKVEAKYDPGKVYRSRHEDFFQTKE